jgi:hypothetical protein
MVHDADEFYFHKDFEKLKEIIKKEPYLEMYGVKGIVFWKSFKYFVKCMQGVDRGASTGGIVSGIYDAVLNLHTIVRHAYFRQTWAIYYKIIHETDLLMYHAAYVLTNEELLKKIKTWAHTNDFNVDKWYNEIWLPWTLESKNLHLIRPEIFIQAEKYIGELPEVLEDLKNLEL